MPLGYRAWQACSLVAGLSRYGRRLDMPRQADPNAGAPLKLGVGRAVDCYLSIMLFHDRIDQCKAQSRTFARVLGGEEGFEQTVDDCLGNTAAFVLDDQVYGVLETFALDPDRAARR